MKKSMLLSLFICFALTGAFAQSGSVSASFFEVYTRLAHPRTTTGFSLNRDSILNRITGIADTASTYATFVISVNNPANADSLALTLSDSRSQLVFTGGGNLSSLQSSSAFKITGNTLYYTVGPFPYLKHFTATATVRGTDGGLTPVKSFTKN